MVFSKPVREAKASSSDLHSHSGMKKVRKRVRLNDAQFALMERVFWKTQYPSSTLCEKIASTLHVPLHSVQIWFQNRRARYRKTVGGTEQASPALVPPKAFRCADGASEAGELFDLVSVMTGPPAPHSADLTSMFESTATPDLVCNACVREAGLWLCLIC